MQNTTMIELPERVKEILDTIMEPATKLML